jgi:hypothetical protein
VSGLNLRDVFHRAGQRVSVHISLHSKTASEGTRQRLRGLGLNITSVVGNKLTGDIAPPQVDALRSDADVNVVEMAKQLRPHGGGEDS